MISAPKFEGIALKARTFFRLSAWAFFLDCIGLMFIIFAVYLCRFTVILFFVFAIIALGFLVKSIDLHIGFRKRLHLWNKLVIKNKTTLIPESFEEFYQAPCGRALIKDVLIELGKQDSYEEMKMKYCRGFFADTPNSGLIIVKKINPEVSSDAIVK